MIFYVNKKVIQNIFFKIYFKIIKIKKRELINNFNLMNNLSYIPY